MKVTYKEKDLLLKFLCENLPPEQSVNVNTDVILHNVDVNKEELLALLKSFERIEIIAPTNYSLHCAVFNITLYTDAFEILNRGGFTFKEQLLEKEVEKLLLEIEALKPSFGNKMTKLTGIASNLASITGAIFTGIKL